MASVRRFFTLAVVAAACIVGPFFFGYNYNNIKSGAIQYLYPANTTAPSQYLHVLLPATGENINLCKLMLTLSVTGYPDPVMIGWKGHGMFNGEESHLFKITETLTYLRSLPPRMDDELVLVLDAYDIWMQLRVEVMISRYYDVIERQNQRLKDEGTFGEFHAGNDIRQTIVFGADKLCWPQEQNEPSCWVTADSDMPSRAFGPNTDHDMFTNRPRWINSGTVLGPVKDMRDFFAASVDMISSKYDPGYNHRTSDQYYFEEVWGEQEANRALFRAGGRENLTAHVNTKSGKKQEWPEMAVDKRTEHHITLDFNADMFQTMSAYDYHVTFMSYNNTTPAKQGLRRRTKRIDEWTIADDIVSIGGPFSMYEADDKLPLDKEWTDLRLGTNSINQNVFPLLHVTGDKSIRYRWWPWLWFHPFGEELLLAEKKRRAKQEDPSVFAVVDGVEWRDPSHRLETVGDDKKGGAWETNGKWLSWSGVCGKHEDELFLHKKKR